MDFGAYESEQELVEAAGQNIEAKEILRAYIGSHFSSLATQYAQLWGAPELSEALYVAGMSVLNKAHTVYLSKPRDPKSADYFLQYFTWWARQAARRAFSELRPPSPTGDIQ